ncbi:MAG: DUF6273 domain-containing protein [Acutalibacteraceae bacterium]|jgi:tetratricopeptide (TPR) repeat protein
MPVFKCKMCGGDLQITEHDTVAQCSYCGTQQTLPKESDEVTANLFNRANNLRLKSDFDKALEVYEKILENDNSNAEAHWGVVLCKYGVEYVEDPKTGKRIPTCHRTQYESVLTDADYLAALANSDSSAGFVYEHEAKQIAELQKDILAVVSREKPFDIFICYKETDESGARTRDSALANDIYHHLTQEGYKVFYAAITLEDKLGQEYEPYIFAALHSAKVMLAVGTRPEHFSAPWVKNEWSRFLQIMKKESGRTLIPCFAGMDAYDLPEEFAHLQALDMSKIGFIADLSRGIGKLLRISQPAGTEKSMPVTTVQNGVNVEGMLERAFIFLEDGDFKSADDYCEKVLDIQPKNARAYIGKLMAEQKICKESELAEIEISLAENGYYQKALRFADNQYKSVLTNYQQTVTARISAYNERQYLSALSSMEARDYNTAIALFASIGDYKDSKEKKTELLKMQSLNITVGDNIYLGRYRMDADASSPEERISWRILEKDNNNVFLVADRVLDIKPFNQSGDETDWEDSTLRKWLNRDFYFSAFSDDEKKSIAESKVINYNNPNSEPDYETIETTDRIFLLSFEEIENYFVSEADRKAEPTQFAKSQSVNSDSGDYCCWWLRSPGDYADEAGIVLDNGDYASFNVADMKGIRPALWLNLPS